jgi:hypothetical protein
VKKIISAFIIFWCFFSPACVIGATVILKSGKMIEGEIVERTDLYIRTESHGMRLTTYLDEIESIDGRLIDTPQDSSSFSASQFKNREQVFADTSLAVVYVTTPEPTGERFLGSGFIVSPQGAVATSFHILKNLDQINVKFKNGTIQPALGVVYQDTTKDICVLKINAQGLPALSLGDSNSVKAGKNFYRMGNPLGFEYSLSDAQMIAKKDINAVQWLQFSTQGDTENVGGPLINADGEAIGLITYLSPDNKEMNFALASNDIKPFLERPPVLFADFLQKITEADYLLVEGFVKFLRGEDDQAISLYDRVVGINPSFFEAYNNRGNAFERKGLAGETAFF